jgi:hypothetical protein
VKDDQIWMYGEEDPLDVERTATLRCVKAVKLKNERKRSTSRKDNRF